MFFCLFEGRLIHIERYDGQIGMKLPIATKGPYYWYSETWDQKYDGEVHIDAIKSPSFPKTLASGDKKWEIIDRPTEEITKWQIGLLPYLLSDLSLRHICHQLLPS